MRHILPALMAIALVSGCQTTATENTAPEATAVKAASESGAESSGDAGDVLPFDGKRHLALAGSAKATCEYEQVTKLPSMNLSERQLTSKTITVRSGRSLYIAGDSGPGLKVEGEAPIASDGSLGKAVFRFSGTMMENAPPRFEEAMNEILGYSLQEFLYAGRNVGMGDRIYDERRLQLSLTSILLPLAPGAVITVRDNEFLVKGIREVEGRETLVTEGYVSVRLSHAGRSLTFRLQGENLIDLGSGLTTDAVFDSVMKQGSIVTITMKQVQNCSVSG